MYGIAGIYFNFFSEDWELDEMTYHFGSLGTKAKSLLAYEGSALYSVH